ncbi:polysaccharide deacetylase family protein [Thermovibrio sp.]
MLVLLYHRVHPKFGVRPEEFKKQMEFLKRHFNVLSLKEAAKGNSSFPLVLITFDDGFYDVFYYAYPILRELSLPAVIFVSPERLLDSQEVRETPEPSNASTYEAFKNSFLKGDNSAFLSWGELKRMGDVFSVQSHALTHRAAVGKGGKPFKGEGRDWRLFSLPEEERERVKPGTPLTSILVREREEAERELLTSKEIIEERLGEEVNSIAFPWGIYNGELLETAKKLGYRYCFTTERGWNRRLSCRVKRLAVGEKKSLRWFKIRSLLYAP